MRHKTRTLYFQVKKTSRGDELWISPPGTPFLYFLTRGKTSEKKIKNWIKENNDKIRDNFKQFAFRFK